MGGKRVLGRLSGLSMIVVTAAVLMIGLASASGNGYDLSYSRAAGTTVYSQVDLTAVSSNDPGGSNITVSFTVSGTIALNPDDAYFVWFGGSTTGNATAWVLMTNNTTAFWYESYYSGGSFGPLLVSVSGGTATFSIAKSVVGPASTFSLNAEALYSSGETYGGSWLGTNYGAGSGGTCIGSSCTTGGGGSSGSSNNWLGIAIVVVAIVVVVVLVVVLMVMRKKKTESRAPAPVDSQQPAAPPQQPPADGAPPPPS
jgi:hypothetical protein